MRLTKEHFQALEKHCPLVWLALSGKRYLLPAWAQADYVNQDACTHYYMTALLHAALLHKDSATELGQLELACIGRMLQYGCPTVYLDRDLGQKLMVTDVPPDLSPSDILMPWPAMRIMIPKGLCSTPTDGGPMSAAYIDLAMIAAGDESAKMPSNLVTDLVNGLGQAGYNAKPVFFSRSHAQPDNDMLLANVGTDLVGSDGKTDFLSWAVRWNADKLKELTGPSTRIMGGSLAEGVGADTIALHQATRLLTMNVLLYLTEQPVYRQAEVVRKARLEGKHHKPELIRATFVSEMNKRVIRPAGTGAKHAAGFHREYGDGVVWWVRGHWRRQACGAGRLDRRLIWVKPFRKGSEAA